MNALGMRRGVLRFAEPRNATTYGLVSIHSYLGQVRGTESPPVDLGSWVPQHGLANADLTVNADWVPMRGIADSAL